MRIRDAVRPAQAHRQLPALPWGKSRQRSQPALLRRASPPGQHDAARDDRAGLEHALDVELEADAALGGLREARYHALDAYVASLPLGRQSVGQTHARYQRRPAVTRGAAGGQHEDPPRVGEDSGRCGQEHGNAQTGQQPRCPSFRQLRLLLQEAHASRE